MTRTEQIKLVKRAARYIRTAEHANDTSFATLCIGVPLTLMAFMGLSVWPGVIFWSVSWTAKAISDRCAASAAELHRLVNASRTG